MVTKLRGQVYQCNLTCHFKKSLYNDSSGYVDQIYVFFAIFNKFGRGYEASVALQCLLLYGTGLGGSDKFATPTLRTVV